MERLRVKLATWTGAVLLTCGVLLFSLALVSAKGRLDLPDRLLAAFFVGGLPLALLGFVIGARYGNLERYSTHYDEETGRIEGHPVGRIINPLSRDHRSVVGARWRFVPSRPLLAVGAFLPSVCIVVFLWWAIGFDALLLGLATVSFFGVSGVAFLLFDRILETDSDDYG